MSDSYLESDVNQADPDLEGAVNEADTPALPPTISLSQPQPAARRQTWLVAVPIVLLTVLSAVAVRWDRSSPGETLPAPAQTQTTAEGVQSAEGAENGAAAPSTDALPGFLTTPSTTAPSNPATPQTALPQTALPQTALPQTPLASSPSGSATSPQIVPPVDLSTPPLSAGTQTTPGGAAHPALPFYQRGEAALKARNVAQAMREYESALRLDAAYIPALERAVAIAVQNKDARKAISLMEAGAQKAPNNPALRIQLSQFYAQTNQAAKAESMAREAVRVAPDAKIKRAAQGNLAQILAAEGKHAAAYGQWTTIAKANTGDAEAAFAAAVLADGALKKPAEAKSWLAKAAKAPVSNPEITVTIARVLGRSNQLKDAERLLSEGARKFPQHIPIHIALAEARLARGDAKAATSTLKAVMPRVPDSAFGGQAKGELYLALAKVYAQQKQWKAAEQETQRAAKLTPKHPAPPALLAEIRFASNDVKGGILALRRVLQLAPQNRNARLMLARALTETKQFSEAKSQLQTYLKSQPKDGDAIAELAGVHEASGDKKQALALWTTLAKHNPKNPLPALQQARLMAALGQDKNALERFRSVLQTQPKQPHALAGAAELEEKTGDAAGAISHLKALIATQPQYAPAYGALARISKKQKQMPATVNFLKEQLAKNPDRPGAYAAILDHYESIGEVEDGRNFVKSYIDKNPKLAAPRAAIDEFDLRRAKAMLSDLEKRDARGASDSRGASESRGSSESRDFRVPRGSTLPTPPPAGGASGTP